jgi:general secretion pathway protein G
MRGAHGLTYVELLVAMTVLAVLATVALPMARWDQKRRDEARLRTTLVILRAAIDKYKEFSDQGKIVPSDVEQLGYPRTLEELVDGVDLGDPDNPEKVRFLARIPIDPMTELAEWGLRSYQDDWDSDTWGRENVYDVYSLSDRRALDGSYYRDW